MTDSTKLHLGTSLAKSVTLLFKNLESRLNLTEPVDALIAGSIAMHFYSGTRVSHDVDVEFSSHILIPQNMAVDVALDDGSLWPLYFDVGHNQNFSLMHQDYLRDSIPLNLGLEFIRPHLLSPIDLVVSKIGRLSDVDILDVVELARLGLVASNAIKRRANEAIEVCVCNKSAINKQLQTVLGLVESVKNSNAQNIKFAP